MHGVMIFDCAKQRTNLDRVSTTWCYFRGILIIIHDAINIMR